MSTTNLKYDIVVKWMLNNDWVETTGKIHDKFKYEPNNLTVTMSNHRAKGKEVSEFNLRYIQKIMNIKTKDELVQLIKQNKSFIIK